MRPRVVISRCLGIAGSVLNFMLPPVLETSSQRVLGSAEHMYVYVLP